tara:strand:+ start:452 stop:772 length:321 start_codon:yes stop_codon:yes gene_type:complete
MKTIQEKIKALLSKKEYLRDCDRKLCTHIWYREMLAKNIDIETFKATDFLRLYAEDKFTTDATIQRLRAKVQEVIPALRGKKYMERQLKQNKVKDDLGYGKKSQYN